MKSTVSEVTAVTVTSGDITALTISTTSDITAVTVQTNDVTILEATATTINTALLSLATDAPEAIARSASVGVSSFVARADHVHSAATLLLDGGSY